MNFINKGTGGYLTFYHKRVIGLPIEYFCGLLDGFLAFKYKYEYSSRNSTEVFTVYNLTYDKAKRLAEDINKLADNYNN